MGRWTNTHTHTCQQNPVTKHPHFASGMGGHNVTGQVVGGGQHVTCDKPSTSKPGRTKNTRADCIGVRMFQERIVTADGSLGRRILWVEMSGGQLVAGRIVWAPKLLAATVNKQVFTSPRPLPDYAQDTLHTYDYISSCNLLLRNRYNLHTL